MQRPGSGPGCTFLTEMFVFQESGRLGRGPAERLEVSTLHDFDTDKEPNAARVSLAGQAGGPQSHAPFPSLGPATQGPSLTGEEASDRQEGRSHR